MHRTGIVIIHAPHPVGEPSRADFQKDELDSGVFLHDPPANQGHDTDHQIEWHTDHVNIEIRILKPFLPRAIKAAGDPMNPHCCAEFISFTEKRIEVRIVEISLPLQYLLQQFPLAPDLSQRAELPSLPPWDFEVPPQRPA